MHKATLGQRLRYNFDNTMAKGPVALIAWLGVLSLGVILVATGVIVALKITPGDVDGEFTPLEAAWRILHLIRWQSRCSGWRGSLLLP